MNLEEYLGIEFDLLGVEVHICHLRPNWQRVGYPAAITIASRVRVVEDTLYHALSHLEDWYRSEGTPSQSLASFVKQTLEADGNAGIAVCDHRDQFSRKRGRIIAKGRLLKVLRQEVKG